MAVANARLTRQDIEVLSEGDSQARLTQQTVEALTENTSEARLTQQVIEVLMKTGNWVHMTQQYIEVLTNAPIDRFASDTLSLTEDNDSVIVEGAIYADADDTLTIDEEDVVTYALARACSDNLTITETFEFAPSIDAEATDTLTITEDNDAIVSELFGYSDTLTITEEDEYLLLPNWFTSDTLDIEETNETLVTFYRDAEDVFDVVESNVRHFSLTAIGSDNLTITEAFFGERIPADGSDTITITETRTAVRIYSRAGSDTLLFTETYSTSNILLRAATDTLYILDNVPRLIDGSYVSIPAFVATVVKPCGAPSSRYCVLSGNSYSVVLPTPQFDDQEELEDEINIFRTQTNRRVITVKRQEMRTLNYSFRLTRKKAVELRNLIKAEIDNRVTWRNWKGEIWVGNIGTNPFSTTADGRWGPCTEGMSVNLQLRAVRTH